MHAHTHTYTHRERDPFWMRSSSYFQCYCFHISKRVVRLFPAYVGCFHDDKDRLFPTPVKVFDNLTPDLCIQNCRTQGYKYAGVQVGYRFCLQFFLFKGTPYEKQMQMQMQKKKKKKFPNLQKLRS